MKIEKIKKLKSGKYKLELDNDEKFVTYDDVIIKNNLLYNKELTSDLLNKINKDNEYYEIYHKLIKFISMRIRSKKEILEFLNKNNYEEKTVEQIINRLTEIGLINDYNFAKAYTSDKFYLNNWGPNKIREGLVEHEISNEIIEDVISDIDEDDLKEKLFKSISKKIKDNKKYSIYQLKQKVLFEYTEKGYPNEVILEVFESIDSNDNGAIEKEYIKIYNKLSRKYSGEKLFFTIKQKLCQKGFDINEIENLINKKLEE